MSFTRSTLKSTDWKNTSLECRMIGEPNECSENYSTDEWGQALYEYNWGGGTINQGNRKGVINNKTMELRCIGQKKKDLILTVIRSGCCFFILQGYIAYQIWSSPGGCSWRIRRLHSCRSVRPPRTSLLIWH